MTEQQQKRPQRRQEVKTALNYREKAEMKACAAILEICPAEFIRQATAEKCERTRRMPLLTGANCGPRPPLT